MVPASLERRSALNKKLISVNFLWTRAGRMLFTDPLAFIYCIQSLSVWVYLYVWRARCRKVWRQKMLAFRAEKCLNIWREKYLVIWLGKKGLRLAGKLSTIFYVWNVLNWIEEMSTCDKKKKIYARTKNYLCITENGSVLRKKWLWDWGKNGKIWRESVSLNKWGK